MIFIKQVLKISPAGDGEGSACQSGIPRVGILTTDCQHYGMFKSCLKDLIIITNFPGKLIGSFLQVVTASMNWRAMDCRDSLWLSPRKWWQGVGTLQD